MPFSTISSKSTQKSASSSFRSLGLLNSFRWNPKKQRKSLSVVRSDMMTRSMKNLAPHSRPPQRITQLNGACPFRAFTATPSRYPSSLKEPRVTRPYGLWAPTSQMVSTISNNCLASPFSRAYGHVISFAFAVPAN